MANVADSAAFNPQVGDPAPEAVYADAAATDGAAPMAEAGGYNAEPAPAVPAYDAPAAAGATYPAYNAPAPAGAVPVASPAPHFVENADLAGLWRANVASWDCCVWMWAALPSVPDLRTRGRCFGWPRWGHLAKGRSLCCTGRQPLVYRDEGTHRAQTKK